MKNISFSSENFQFVLEVKFTIYLNRCVFEMSRRTSEGTRFNHICVLSLSIGTDMPQQTV